jgi:hypothetical protein
VPLAINSGSKFMNFRPFTSHALWKETENFEVQKHNDKGCYYKFNCNNEIKLIKCLLEDNGFLPVPFVSK